MAAPARLPTTEIQAATLDELAKQDFSAKLGSVGRANEPRADYRAGHAHFQTTMTEIGEKLRDRFLSTDEAVRKAADAEIISQVSGMPDGYKQLAISYVREAMAKGQPVMPDTYAGQGTRLFTSDDNLPRVQQFLKDKEAPVAATQPRVLQPRPVPEYNANPQIAATQPATQPTTTQPSFTKIPDGMMASYMPGNDGISRMATAGAVLGQFNMGYVMKKPVEPEQVKKLLEAYDAADPKLGAALRKIQGEMQTAYEEGKPLPDLKESVKKLFDAGPLQIRPGPDGNLRLEAVSQNSRTTEQALLINERAQGMYAAAQYSPINLTVDFKQADALKRDPEPAAAVASADVATDFTAKLNKLGLS